jgi:hypothetical protein
MQGIGDVLARTHELLGLLVGTYGHQHRVLGPLHPAARAR